MAYPTFFFKWRHVYKQNFRFFIPTVGCIIVLLVTKGKQFINIVIRRKWLC